MDLPARRISSNSPAPPDLGLGNHRAAFVQDSGHGAIGSPAPSAPGTPQSLALPMNPPPTSHSRRSSFGSQMGGGAAARRSVSPSPSMPLPAVMPSASPSISGSFGVDVRNANLYANETFTSFFRRLAFTPDGALLLTPAGQFKTSTVPGPDATKKDDDILNTVYIYTRAGLNKPPVAHLPGHKKPSIAVKCSPVYYNLRVTPSETKEITIDTKAEDDIPLLPEPAHPTRPPPTSHASMDPPPLAPSPSPSAATMASPRVVEAETSPTTTGPPAGPAPAFSLPYRVVYAVATQDAVHVYDTQQTKPLCVVSNLHYATFTDLTWSSDGQTLLMTSSDGFCSALTFAPGELGSVYHPPPGVARHTPTPISVARANSAASTPQATPTTVPAVPAMTRQPSNQSNNNGVIAPPPAPSPSPFSQPARPASPARSMSASSAASFAHPPDQNAPPVMNNPTPSMSSVPSMTAAGSGVSGALPLVTPPQTPGGPSHNNGSMSSVSGVVAGVKRESVASESSEEGNKEKRRRIAPTLVESGSEMSTAAPAPPEGTEPRQDGH